MVTEICLIEELSVFVVLLHLLSHNHVSIIIKSSLKHIWINKAKNVICSVSGGELFDKIVEEEALLSESEAR